MCSAAGSANIGGVHIQGGSLGSFAADCTSEILQVLCSALPGAHDGIVSKCTSASDGELSKLWRHEGGPE